MSREDRIAELKEAGIECSPEKMDSANAAGVCFIALIGFVIFAFIFGERPVQKPVQSTTTNQVATTR